MTLAMSWDEWTAHDGTALAARVRAGELTPAELAAQAAAGIARTNGPTSAVVEVFDDVVADPLQDGMNPDGVFAGLPYLMKDLGPTLKGRLQEITRTLDLDLILFGHASIDEPGLVVPHPRFRERRFVLASRKGPRELQRRAARCRAPWRRTR